jgi:hypothetical protein
VASPEIDTITLNEAAVIDLAARRSSEALKKLGVAQ